jgi:hypothetical protein
MPAQARRYPQAFFFAFGRFFAVNAVCSVIPISRLSWSVEALRVFLERLPLPSPRRKPAW